MNEPINIHELREWYGHDKALAALLDLAEAAHAHIHVDARYPAKRAETRHTLRRALARFTFTP